MKKNLLICSLLMMMTLPGSAISADSDQTFELSQSVFVAQAFNGVTPDAKRVWIRGELKTQVEDILQHRADYLRIKYWLEGDTSVWIIDEIGKEKPITTGIIVKQEEGISHISNLSVLAFRESRGWEVKHNFFTEQFIGVHLEGNSRNTRLSPTIDGITGATLSVRAVKKSSEIALLLDEHVRK